MTEAIEEVIWPAIGLIFLLLGIVLIASILFSAFNPYDQIAFANAEKLRAAINEACFKATSTSSDPVMLNSIELRQNTPAFTWILTILPRWLIRANGDPNYLLYYESFPPGEALSWEVYHDFQNRLIVPLPDDYITKYGESGRNVEKFVKDVLDNYLSKPENQNKPVDAVIINNILLSEAFRSDFLLKRPGFRGGTDSPFEVGGPAPTTEPTAAEKFFSYGKWQEQYVSTKLPSDIKNQFVFANYLGLTDLEKTAIKYQTCAPNSLCLKTRTGVYTFPLDQCTNIKDVQLNYDATDDPAPYKKFYGAIAGGLGSYFLSKLPGGKVLGALGIGIAIEKYLEGRLQAALSYKTGDFAIASPCVIHSSKPITIQKAKCDNICEDVVHYSLYQYNADTGNLEKVKFKDMDKDHYVCTQSIGEDSRLKMPFDSSDECIQVNIIRRVDEHCWLSNPYKDPHSNWYDWFLFTLKTEQRIEVKTVYKIIFGLPMQENTEFFSDGNVNAIVLKPTRPARSTLDTIIEYTGRAWGWGWP